MWLGCIVAFCAALGGWGCGATARHNDAPGLAQSGSGNVAGNGGAGDVAGAGGGGGAGSGSLVTEYPLEPGECGVVRTIELPTSQVSPAPLVTRQGASFAVGPWHADSSSLRGLVIEEHGAHRDFAAAGSTNDLSWPMLLVEPDLALEVFLGGSDSFESRAWSNHDGAPRLRGNVLDAVWRGTNGVALVPALDGRRGVFAIWPHAISEPRAAVIGPDGARVGQAHSFPVMDTNLRCSTVTPTAHGGVVSFVDSENELHLFELGGEGELVREVSWPLPTAGFGCPSFALAEGGLSFLFDRTLVGDAPDIGLYRVDAEGAVSEIALRSPTDARHFALLGDEPLLLRWSPEGSELVRPGREEVWPISLPDGHLTRVPSEAGSIWLDLSSLDEGRTLAQLSCR